MSEDTSWSLGPVTVLGAHILDVLGRPVEAIPPGQGSARLLQIRATGRGVLPARRRPQAARHSLLVPHQATFARSNNRLDGAWGRLDGQMRRSHDQANGAKVT
jgi:hypothetical protein